MATELRTSSCARLTRHEPFDGLSARIFCPRLAGMSHLMRTQLGFFCGVTPALRNSEPFDELSARIFVPGYSSTMNPADPDNPKTLQATTRQLTEPYISITIVPIVESAFDFDTEIICLVPE